MIINGPIVVEGGAFFAVITAELEDGELSSHKDELSDGVARALAKTSERDGDTFRSVWVEVRPMISGTGQPRGIMDQGKTLVGAFLRSINFVEKLVADMDSVLPKVKSSMKVGIDELRKMDFLVHQTTVAVHLGMEWAALICALQVLFNRQGKGTDVFLAFFDECTGKILWGAHALPPKRDMHAMRRAGINRLFIGETTGTDQAKQSAMVDAAQDDLGPDVPALETIILTNHKDLMRYLDPNDPTSIFSDRPLRKLPGKERKQGEPAIPKGVEPIDVDMEGKTAVDGGTPTGTDDETLSAVGTEVDDQQEDMVDGGVNEDNQQADQPQEGLWGTFKRPFHVVSTHIGRFFK